MSASPQAERIVRISRVVADLDRAEAFYRDALRFEPISRGAADKAALFALARSNIEAEEAVLRLGSATIALVRFAIPGRAYPRDSRSDDLCFQHLAVVVSDMDAAYAHLVQASMWQAISEHGPQLLPPSNGSVRAFKFRDPDGHPLELIWFPPGHEQAHSAMSDRLFLDVDHSALSVSSILRSVTFYRAVGFRVTARSFNHGPAQARLDGLPDARVRVAALRPASGSRPGLELLGYKPPGRPMGPTELNNAVTDWVTIEVNTLCGELRRAVRDPDGHRLLLVDQGSGVPA